MLSHEQIWAAIDTLAAKNGMSPSGLARRAGLDPTTFNPSKRFGGDGRPRWPSTESLSKILEATGESLDTLLDVLKGRLPGNTRSAPYANQVQMVPVAGFSDASQLSAFDKDGRPSSKMWDQMQFPDPKAKGLFALEISTPEPNPFYRQGDILIVDRQQAIRRGDRVLVRMADGDLKLYVMARQNATDFEFHSLSPPVIQTSIQRASIAWVARILWASQ